MTISEWSALIMFEDTFDFADFKELDIFQM